MNQQPRLIDAARGAAQQLGLFDALSTPISISALAQRFGLGAWRLQRLVDVLIGSGDLTREENGALRRSDTFVLPAAQAIGARLIVEILRRDRPVTSQELLGAQLDIQYLAVYHLLSEATGEPARELARHLLPELQDGGSLLDAGGGHAAYCAALRELMPDLRALIVDLPHVIAQGRKHLPPRAGFIEWRSGSLIDAPLLFEHSPRHRVGLLSNVLHLNSPQNARRIVFRVAEALAPGGLLVVKDLRLQADRSGPMLALLFALAMALFSPDAEVADQSTLIEYVRDAGLIDVREETLASAPEAILVLGRRPAP
jgi:hypothetical protein